MPDVSYKWNKTKIDIIIDDDEKNREQDIKTFTFFMKTLQIKGVSEGIIAKLYDNSYNTINKIINIKKKDILNINGFKEKSADNLLSALSSIKTKSCIEIMIASNIIGRGLGERKLIPILNKYPFICGDKKQALKLTVDDIKIVDGIGDILAIQFIENLQKFYDFYEEIGMKLKEKENENEKEKNNINKNIENKHFSFSGFRNKTFEDYIKNNNGIVDDTVKNTTNYLIVKDKTKTTNKIKNAIEKGTILLSIEEFELTMTK
jgi:DNA ligase (NAD+)